MFVRLLCLVYACVYGRSFTPLQPKCSKDTVFRSKNKGEKREESVKKSSFSDEGNEGSEIQVRKLKAHVGRKLKKKTNRKLHCLSFSERSRKQKAENVKRFWCCRLKKSQSYMSCFVGSFPVEFTSVIYSRPKVLVSSTAVTSFSYSIENDGYGGRSRRLKQVCALGNEVILPHFSTQNLRGPLLPRRDAKPS